MGWEESQSETQPHAQPMCSDWILCAVSRPCGSQWIVAGYACVSQGSLETTDLGRTNEVGEEEDDKRFWNLRLLVLTFDAPGLARRGYCRKTAGRRAGQSKEKRP